MRSLKYAVMIWCCTTSIQSYSQNASHSVRVSVPAVWNASETAHHTLGQRRSVIGEELSLGLNISYTQVLFGPLNSVGGIGLLKQAFGLSRAVHMDAPIQPVFYTKRYIYHSIHLFAGANFAIQLDPEFFMTVESTYNWLHSYKQKYITSSFSYPQRTRRKKLGLGNFILASVGIERRVMERVKCGVAIVALLDVRWNDDKTFIGYSYSDDTQRIAKNILSMGLNFSVRYDLNKFL
jgi:hypothetical protein